MAPAIEGRDAKTGTDIGEFIHPVAAMAGVTVELQNSGAAPSRVEGPEVFSVDARPPDTGEPQIKTLGGRRLEREIGS